MDNTVEMAGIAVVAVGVMAGEMIVRRRKQRVKLTRRSIGPLPNQAAVFLGHDLRWTPSYSPEPKPDADAEKAPCKPQEDAGGFARI